MSNKRPEALRVADALDGWGDQNDLLEASAKLRSQHELIVEMREVLEKAMPMLALLVLAGSSEADAVGVTMGKLIAKAEAQS